MNKTLFIKEFFFSIFLPGTGIGFAGLMAVRYLNIFLAKKFKKEDNGGEK